MTDIIPLKKDFTYIFVVADDLSADEYEEIARLLKTHGRDNFLIFPESILEMILEVEKDARNLSV